MIARQRRRHARVWLVLLPMLLIGIVVGVAARKPSLRPSSVDEHGPAE